MTANRQLNWEGCINVRDLGGLPTRSGQTTRRGAIVRGDHPARLSAAGWMALHDYGIRTIIELHTHGMNEDAPDQAPRPADLVTLPVAIEDITDTDFVQRWCKTDLWGTPLYFRDALQRWPARHAAAIAAVARAQPGGVLVHCIRGYDRTGIITLLLLALVGVLPEEIAADYALSLDSYREELLQREGTTTRQVILDTLAGLDVENYLLSGGIRQADLDALRSRFLEPKIL